MNPERTVAVHDIRITLPEQWWLVPLGDPDARSRSVALLVDRQFAGMDDQPLAKAQVRRLLADQAAAAGEFGARRMALSVFDYAGAPVPASLLHLVVPSRNG